jgi:anti-sigma28 factor (negative regulator of flagellin synthesis)
MPANRSTVPGKVITMIKVKEQPPEQPADSAADRAIRIKKLKMEIEAGTYKVAAQDLADRMMERLDWL